MTALLLDTHAWIWLAAGDERMARHERLLQRNAMIVAAAIHARARLATADAKILAFAKRAGVQVLEL